MALVTLMELGFSKIRGNDNSVGIWLWKDLMIYDTRLEVIVTDVFQRRSVVYSEITTSKIWTNLLRNFKRERNEIGDQIFEEEKSFEVF